MAIPVNARLLMLRQQPLVDRDPTDESRPAGATERLDRIEASA